MISQKHSDNTKDATNSASSGFSEFLKVVHELWNGVRDSAHKIFDVHPYVMNLETPN